MSQTHAQASTLAETGEILRTNASAVANGRKYMLSSSHVYVHSDTHAPTHSKAKGPYRSLSPLLQSSELDGGRQGTLPRVIVIRPCLQGWRQHSHHPLPWAPSPHSPTRSPCPFFSSKTKTEQERVWETAGTLLSYSGWPLRSKISLLW